MNSEYVILTVVLCVAASGVTFGLIKLLDYLRRRDAESESRRIIAQTKQELDNRRREFELELKEIEIQRKAEGRGLARAPRRTPRARTHPDKRQTPFERAIRSPQKTGENGRDTAQVTERIQTTEKRNQSVSPSLSTATLHE